jgi:hypothetical protein
MGNDRCRRFGGLEKVGHCRGVRYPRLCGLTVIDVESLSEGYARPDSWPVPALERAGIVMVIEPGLLLLRPAAFRLQRSAIVVEPGVKVSPSCMQMSVPDS